MVQQHLRRRIQKDMQSRHAKRATEKEGEKEREREIQRLRHNTRCLAAEAESTAAFWPKIHYFSTSQKAAGAGAFF